MDVCCLSRLYDDESYSRIRLESEAIRTILASCEKGVDSLIGSFAIEMELSKTVDVGKKEKIESLLVLVNEKVKSDEVVNQRAFCC